MDPRGFQTTLPEFQRVFPDDAACARFLEHLRWPERFVCSKCGNVGEPYRFAKRRTVVLRCRACHSNISLTVGTVMQQSHTPLSTWFWGAYLVTTQTPGMSAVQFQRQLGPTFRTSKSAYFSDRGRLFQSDRGRRFSVIADAISV